MGERTLCVKVCNDFNAFFLNKEFGWENARASIICYAYCYVSLTFLTNAGERGKLKICFQGQNRQITMNHKNKIDWIANFFPSGIDNLNTV